jgi:hypothetical protein
LKSLSKDAGAPKARISAAGSAAKAARARELGVEDVIDLTAEGLADGVRRKTAGRGVYIVIESIGGTMTSEALSSLDVGGVLITLGYSAGRKTTLDVTGLIWKGARMPGFSLFAQSSTAIATAWRDIIPLFRLAMFVLLQSSARTTSRYWTHFTGNHFRRCAEAEHGGDRNAVRRPGLSRRSLGRNRSHRRGFSGKVFGRQPRFPYQRRGTSPS